MSSDSSLPPNENKVYWDIKFTSLLKIVAVVGFVFLLDKMATLFLLFFSGLLLAVSLHPFCRMLQKLGLSKSISIAVITILMSGLIALLGMILIPSIFNQVASLISSFSSLRDNLLKEIPEGTAFKTAVSHLLHNPKLPDPGVLMDGALSVFNHVFEGITELFIILIFSIYLLVDGKRAFKWIGDFFKAPVRLKLHATANETSKLIYGYALGQVITSLYSGFFAFLVLKILHVPGALTLSVLAAIFDVLPILGFFLALIPAVLLALTVSPATAVFTLTFYLCYHAFESYVLIPLIYGNRMKVSGLVVLISLLVAGSVGGILLAICILPVVASYPIIEKIWLMKYLGRHVVTKHAESSPTASLSEQVRVWKADLLKIRRLHSPATEDMIKKMNKKILIVDDDPDIQSLLQDVLETEGYQTLTANNGVLGLEILEKNHGIGLILLDVMMPVMNGRAFLDKMRKVGEFADIPVVFLSAAVDTINTDGADGVLMKPAEIDVVLDIVDKHYRDTVV